ncbi:hypothetical protein G5B39_14495 (plasmid) [Rhodobacteraceae bacterium SC52]|nr:hypothetical protein G5B39_14495 [Rhodobacteraceae bacterium SC52]
MNRGQRIGLIALLAFGNAQIALACGVCVEKPEETVSDRLLAADAVVIAREDRDNPYSFAPVMFLLGASNDVPIPFLVDSITKRRLDRNPADGVLMLREGNAWSRAGYANAAWRSAAAKILAHGSDWQINPTARFSFFEAMLHGPDRFLREQAIDELSRASYDLISEMAQPINGAVARQALTDRSEIPWQSFYILMLGLSDRNEDHDHVRERIARAARLKGEAHLDAWATALIEIDGSAGVTRLVNTWLEASHQSTEALRDVIAALTVHAKYGDPSLKAGILAALARLPQQRPEVVGSVAVAFGEIGDFSRAEVISSAMSRLPAKEKQRIDAAELFAAASYLYRSQNAGITAFDPLQGN